MLIKGGPKPWLLFVDNHKSHHSLQVAEICQEHEIIMVGLPPNCTRLMQPNDVLFFGNLKLAFAAVLKELRCSEKLFYLNNENFARVLELSIKKAAQSDVLKSGFRRTGLSPWDPEAPDYNQLHTTIDPPNKNCSVDELMFKNWADKLIFVESTNPLLQVDIHDCSLFVDPEENDDFSEDWQEISGETTTEEESVEIEYLEEGGESLFVEAENSLQLLCAPADPDFIIAEESADFCATEILLDSPCIPELLSTDYSQEPSTSGFQHTHQEYHVSTTNFRFKFLFSFLASHF
jgi:hypothetical protein